MPKIFLFTLFLTDVFRKKVIIRKLACLRFFCEPTAELKKQREATVG